MLRGCAGTALALAALLGVATCALMRGQDNPAPRPPIVYGPPSPPYHGDDVRRGRGGCGSRGGPGGRGASGKCESWREKRSRHRH